MFRGKKLVEVCITLTKRFSTSLKREFKVAVLGATGGIGQPLSLLLKQNPYITHLSLYDIEKCTQGVALDISHVNTSTTVDGYVGKTELFCALYGAHVVIISAGRPRKEGMSRDDLFKSNADIILELTCAIARFSPFAIIGLITNPVNGIVPLCTEIMIKSGMYDPNKIFGITTLDLIRASVIVAKLNCTNPAVQHVPVVGGHAGATIVPLLSQCNPPVFLPDATRDELTRKIQDAGTEVVRLKAGTGSATMSMAFAAARFAGAVLRGLAGEANIVEYAYVRSNLTDATFFATPLLFGRCGMVKNLGWGVLSAYEKNLVEKAIPDLKKSIKEGIDFVNDKVIQAKKIKET